MTLKPVDKIKTAESAPAVRMFYQTLKEHGLALERGETKTLQINLGLACNQNCAHCHLEAGPDRDEMMTRQTMDQVVHFAATCEFDVIDLTGGAPELHEDLEYLIEKISPFAGKILLRSNLSALSQKGEPFIAFLKHHHVNIVASFPSLNEIQAESLRGKGVFKTSIAALQKLNSAGYGMPVTGRDLDIVFNPAGAFLSPSQNSLEKRFRHALEQKWGIRFNHLYSFANVPLGRFRKWLTASGNLDNYMEKLVSSFNPSAVNGVMCRSLLSVSWEGYLYDCDFNQAANLFLGNTKTHISEIKAVPVPGTRITTGDHCYTCTAGAGFT